MTPDSPRTIYLKDYQPPNFLVSQVELYFDLHEQETFVRSKLKLQRNPEAADDKLILEGEDLELLSISLDGQALEESDYELTPRRMIIAKTPNNFLLEMEVRILPQENKALEGLYKSSGIFCTQCEAEGFRHITYYPDRPDVMARFTTTIEAERKIYPVLLSNGNLIEEGELSEGRHYAKWEDPFPKPCYLFALVAGNLFPVEDHFTTFTGRDITLRIYVEEENQDKCGHAMHSLKQAMAWDERAYGREYDLDLFMIVAVSDFNMGAMENKGLNIFNSSLVLALPETATDQDYERITGVIGHEYFHNWSGNRVTCRDWFQLSLKEGFTVLRDQQFSADVGSPAIQRIVDVSALKTRQFTEDAGPLAHNVRPESYQEINNFYTFTVYEKGAEVVRMLHTLLGPELFRAGTDLYFERHDHMAVTCDDFVKAMEDASGRDLAQFGLWYSQAGTPILDCRGEYDPQEQSYTLTVDQSCPPTPKQPVKKAMHIPLAIGLMGADGLNLPLRLEGETGLEEGADQSTRVLELVETQHRFRFVGIAKAPVPSLLRGFSAPVRLNFDYSDTELAFLIAHDSDAFNRWDAAQRLALRLLKKLIADIQNDRAPALPEDFIIAFGNILADRKVDPRLAAEVLTLPDEIYLAGQCTPADPDAIHEAREFMRRELAERLKFDLLRIYKTGEKNPTFSIDAQAMASRAIRNVCLYYLMALDEEEIRILCQEQFEQADNMTDELTALEYLCNTEGAGGDAALNAFYDKWRHDPLVVDKWFRIQSTSILPDTLERVQSLMSHSAFKLENPNRVRALIGGFAVANPYRFHAKDGSGYDFLAAMVLKIDEDGKPMITFGFDQKRPDA